MASQAGTENEEEKGEKTVQEVETHFPPGEQFLDSIYGTPETVS